MIEPEYQEEENTAMTEKQIVECELLRRLFTALHLEGFALESGDRPDVTAVGNGCRIGIEVTEFHSDEGQSSRGGSIQRKTEKQINRNASGRPYAMWGVVDPMPALITRIMDKVEKAKHYQIKNFDELWLLIGAAIPQPGAMVSTYILSPALDLEKLNDCTHNLLRDSPFAKGYLHVLMGNGLYQWLRSEKWHVIQAPREVKGVPWSRFKALLNDPKWLRDPRGQGRSEMKKALEEWRAMQ